MKQLTIILFALLALTAAMVPRDRRAVNTEEEEERLREETTTDTVTTEPQPKICAPQTPCAWSVYKPNIKIIEMNITNTYCKCSADTVCQLLDDDSAVSAYVHRCRSPTFKPNFES